MTAQNPAHTPGFGTATVVEQPRPVNPGRISWSGIFAGFLAGIATYIVLSVLGLAIGLVTVEANGEALGNVAIGTVIWMAISMAISAFLAGLTAARAAGGLTMAQGRFNGVMTGIALVAASTIWGAGLVLGGLNSALGLAGNVANTVSSGVGAGVGAAAANSGPLGGALQTLGVEDQYRAITNGLGRDDIAGLITEAAPNLTERQVNIASATVESVVRDAARNVGNNLTNINDLGGLLNQQAEAVATALSGPGFTQRLQARGLSAAQAQQVSTAIGRRVTEIRDQAAATATAVSQRAEELARSAAGTTGRIAWIWLLLSGIVIALCTFGGGRGHDEREIAVTDGHLSRVDTPRDNRRTT